MSQTTYIVQGMTCSHCASSVTEEISRLDGVHGVDVDVATGKVTVSSDRQLVGDEVRDAVAEAGYQLVS
jgi:copper ion binding protein